MPSRQKSGLYRTKIKIGVDADGKDIVKWISGRTKADLERARQEVIAKYIDNTALNEDQIFGSYAVNWFNAVKAPQLSPSSLESYRTALNKDILPEFGERKLRSVSATELQLFMNRFKGWSATKITVLFAALDGIFSAACADRIRHDNPMDHVHKPKATPAEEKTPLTAQERARIEHVCATQINALYLALMYYLGLRPGEARGLQWGDINWMEKTVHIQRDIDYKDHGRVGAVKTEKSNRTVPLPAPLAGILGALRGMPDMFVVRGEKGGALSKSSAERLWTALMVDCGMADPTTGNKYRSGDVRSKWAARITPHAIRHNYATMCWESGLDPYTTMRLMGHASIKTTMDIYTHLNEMQLKRISEKVDDMFQKQSCTKVAQKISNGWKQKQ